MSESHKGATELICPFCQKMFTQKFTLRRHISSVHDTAGAGEGSEDGDGNSPFQVKNRSIAPFYHILHPMSIYSA